MKKTNVALLHSATRWARYLPLLLCFIVFGSSDLAAQNYKSQDEAAISVKEALEQVIGNLNTTNERTDLQSTSERKTVYTFSYYTEYLTQLESSDTEEAMLALDKIYPINKLQGSLQDIPEDVREDLMNLITD